MLHKHFVLGRVIRQRLGRMKKIDVEDELLAEDRNGTQKLKGVLRRGVEPGPKQCLNDLAQGVFRRAFLKEKVHVDGARMWNFFGIEQNWGPPTHDDKGMLRA